MALKNRKQFLYVLLACLIITGISSCDPFNNCGECFTPPGGLPLRILSKVDSSDMLYSGAYHPDSVRIFYMLDDYPVDFQLYIQLDATNQSGALYCDEISWKSLDGYKNSYLYLNVSDTDTIYLDVVRVTENCCTYHVFNELKINGMDVHQEEDYHYILWK